jgi:hypothetical protein
MVATLIVLETSAGTIPLLTWRERRMA